MTLIKNPSTGRWVQVAGGQRMWIGTKEQMSQDILSGAIPSDSVVLAMVTNDGHGDGPEIVDAVENGNMNAVTSNAVYDALSIESHTLLANTLPADTAVTVAQITVPKGKWMIFGQLHTQPFTSGNNLLSLAISVNGTAAAGETVDQRRQVAGIWGFAHGMLLVNPTAGPETIKLVGVVTADTWQGTAEVGVIKAEIVAVRVAD